LIPYRQDRSIEFRGARKVIHALMLQR
jgi:hypothetical protein